MEQSSFERQLNCVLPLSALSPPDHTRVPAIKAFSDYVFVSRAGPALQSIGFREMRTFIPEIFWIRLAGSWRLLGELNTHAYQDRRGDPGFNLPPTNMAAICDLASLENDRLLDWLTNHLGRIAFYAGEALKSYGSRKVASSGEVPAGVSTFLEENGFPNWTEVTVNQVLPLLDKSAILRRYLVETYLRVLNPM